MYRILIAEDEYLIRKGLISKLEYYKLEFAEILEAENGKQAFDIIMEQKPDIVITDIRMPFMDGLQLIRKTKEMDSNIKYIIISGYAEFEYAEQALNMGVSGYILKPIVDQDLVRTLKRVIEEIEYENKAKEASSRKDILEKYCEDIALEKRLNQAIYSVKHDGKYVDYLDLLRELQLDESYRYVLGLINIDGKTYYQSAFNYQDVELIKFSVKNIISDIEAKGVKIAFNSYKDKNQILVILCSNDESYLKVNSSSFFAKVYNSIVKYLGISITIGISSSEDMICYELFRQAKEAFDQRLVNGDGRLYSYDSIAGSMNITIPQDEINLLRKYIERRDIGNIEIILKAIFFEKNLENSAAIYIRVVWTEIANMLIKAVNESKPDLERSIYPDMLNWEILNRFNNVEEIVSYLYTSIIDFLKLDKVADMKSRSKIKMAIQYIEQHYNEEISINEIAYMYAMSPNYFSTVFKKETGMTVVNYITDMRIKNACRLLKETKASIVDVSHEVGYQDTQYFFRVFKKITGKTPLEYRKGD